MITLTEKWTSSNGCIFPIGTVFIPRQKLKRGTAYVYGTPGGDHGEVLIDAGDTPGV